MRSSFLRLISLLLAPIHLFFLTPSVSARVMTAGRTKTSEQLHQQHAHFAKMGAKESARISGKGKKNSIRGRKTTVGRRTTVGGRNAAKVKRSGTAFTTSKKSTRRR